MNFSKFFTLPVKEKKRIIKSAIKAANKEQREVVKHYSVKNNKR